VRHGIGLFSRVEIQPGALYILLHPAQPCQAKACTLTDNPNQILRSLDSNNVPS
jgi:hypothetical protein